MFIDGSLDKLNVVLINISFSDGYGQHSHRYTKIELWTSARNLENSTFFLGHGFGEQSGRIVGMPC
jgi:hypothetical protein